MWANSSEQSQPVLAYIKLWKRCETILESRKGYISSILLKRSRWVPLINYFGKIRLTTTKSSSTWVLDISKWTEKHHLFFIERAFDIKKLEVFPCVWQIYHSQRRRYHGLSMRQVGCKFYTTECRGVCLSRFSHLVRRLCKNNSFTARRLWCLRLALFCTKNEWNSLEMLLSKHYSTIISDWLLLTGVF